MKNLDECFSAYIARDLQDHIVFLSLGNFCKNLDPKEVKSELDEVINDLDGDCPLKLASNLINNTEEIKFGTIYYITVNYRPIYDDYPIFTVIEILENKNVSNQLHLLERR